MIAIVLALAASAAAGLCAYADGALLGVEPETLADRTLDALVARRDRTHRALAFARVVLQLVAGALSGVALAGARGAAAIPLGVLVLGGLALVVVSETAARDAGESAGAPAVSRMRQLIEAVERGLSPVVMLGDAIDRAFAPPSRAEPSDEVSVAAEPGAAAAPDYAASGVAEPTGVFSLRETTVAEVMTPRVNVIGIERDAPWAEVLARARSSEHARLLVHDGSLDGVVGVLYAKDLLPFVASDTAPDDGWPSLVRPASFIPGTKSAESQLRDFRSTGRHFAVVVDEFGGTAGIVTIEDILELIVGEIHDEYDTDEPEIREDAGRYWVAGRLTLDQLSDAVGDDLRHGDVTTVGGLAYELFGRVPAAGESAEYRNWRFVVERVRGRRVERVFLERAGVAVGAEDGI